MSKNIVICLDGTGNQIENNLSNVLKLYRTLKKTGKQLVYYDQGVGTLGQQNTWGRISQKIKAVWGLATGHGLDANVLNAYRFLIEHFEHGGTVQDKIYIFGFSRGAHTARTLAGLIYMMGILRPDQVNLAGATLTAYKRATTQKGKDSAYHFRRITAAKSVSIEFLGVWDTVSSVITPRADRFFIPSLEVLPHTQDNPAVKVFRQAMAIDERRRMFRLDHWADPQDYKPNPHSQGKTVAQDIKQCWFAGVHSDVGGGYARSESALAQYPLKWMIDEAKDAGLIVLTQMYNHVVLGRKLGPQNTHTYPEPDHRGKIHNSMGLGWVWMEILPKSRKRKEPPNKKAWGIYLPFAERRHIADGANIHISAEDRKSDADVDYSPKNFPDNFKQVK